jgi:hypothetical protein
LVPIVHSKLFIPQVQESFLPLGGGIAGLSAATMREIESAAAAKMASRKPRERASGARALHWIAVNDVGFIATAS